MAGGAYFSLELEVSLIYMFLSGTWYFSNFFFLIFTTFCLLYPPHFHFSQCHSSRKDKTRAIDPIT